MNGWEMWFLLTVIPGIGMFTMMLTSMTTMALLGVGCWVLNVLSDGLPVTGKVKRVAVWLSVTWVVLALLSAIIPTQGAMIAITTQLI